MIEDLEKRFVELVRKPYKSEQDLVEKETIRKELELQLAKQTQQLTEELNKVGIRCSDVWDLVNTKTPYPEAISILINHLGKNYHDRNKEGIIRALTVKEAKGKASSMLIKEYERTQREKENLRWIIGNAITVTMTLADVPWVFEAVVNKANGKSRGQLVLALGTIKSERAEEILIDLLDDEEVAAQALAALGKMKSVSAKEKILRMKES